jgi:hypothetical protein
VSRELIFTSAPRGLRPGSQGFCTVAHTQGMPASLIQQLESLSGYRHLFLPPDPKAALNPVVFSHLVLTVAGRRCHVLSRICDAGLDYTQRTNKLAHHVVLDAAEVPAAGPAWLLQQAEFMRSTWASEPSVLPKGPIIPSGESKPCICHAWQRLTGDAGWGGVLAQTAAGTKPRQAVLVFPPGMEVFPLLAESFALLPADLRWRVSFSTYFTNLPAGIGCQWRCVVEGTPEAAAMRRGLRDTLVIDLCQSLQRAVGWACVDAARTGKKPAVVTAEYLSDAELEHALREGAERPITENVGLSVLPDIQVPVRAGAPPPVSLPQRPVMPEPLQFARKRPSRWPWLLGAAASILMLLGGGVALWSAYSGSLIPHLAFRRDGPRAANKAEPPQPLVANSGTGLPATAAQPRPEKSQAATGADAQRPASNTTESNDGAKSKTGQGKNNATQIKKPEQQTTPANQAKADSTAASKGAPGGAKKQIAGAGADPNKPLPTDTKLAAKQPTNGSKPSSVAPTSEPDKKGTVPAQPPTLNVPRPQQSATEDWLKTLRPANELPAPPSLLSNYNEGKATKLATIDSSLPTGRSLRLKLIACRDALGGGATWKLYQEDDRSPNWKLAIVRPGLEDTSKTDNIAAFSCRDKGLWFHWLKLDVPRMVAAQLSNCILQFNVNEQPHDVALRLPLSGAPFYLKLLKPTGYALVEKAHDVDQPFEYLVGDLQIRLSDVKSEAPSAFAYSPGPGGALDVYPTRTVSVGIRTERPPDPYLIALSLHATVKAIPQRDNTVRIRMTIQPSILHGQGIADLLEKDKVKGGKPKPNEEVRVDLTYLRRAKRTLKENIDKLNRQIAGAERKGQQDPATIDKWRNERDEQGSQQAHIQDFLNLVDALLGPRSKAELCYRVYQTVERYQVDLLTREPTQAEPLTTH